MVGTENTGALGDRGKEAQYEVLDQKREMIVGELERVEVERTLDWVYALNGL